MILVLSEADVTRALSMADGVRIVEQALRTQAVDGGVAIPRMGSDLPGNGGAFRVMAAVLPSAGYFGLKTLTGYPGRRLPGETYFAILLFSMESGALRAVISANRLTGIRTGAASGVAARYLSRSDSRVVGIIGAGVQARYQIAAVAEVRALTEVRVFDADAAKAATFAREIEDEFGVAARTVVGARDAVAGCDVVIAITTAKAPVLDGQWVEEGTLVIGAGANTPAKRELDPLIFQRSKIVVDFKEQAMIEAGDLQEAIRTGAIQADSIHAELGEIIAGSKTGRENTREITLFKSVGMAIEDLATATFAYQRALTLGLGTDVLLENAVAVQAPVNAAGR